MNKMALNQYRSISEYRSVSLDCINIDNTIDNCNECNDRKISVECDKCGNGVCNNIECQWAFPHRGNTTYTICNGCYQDIDYKLIDFNHLLIYKFLKRNVRRRRISC